MTDPVSEKKLRLIQLEGMEMENKMLAVLHENKYITQPMQMILDTLKGMPL